MIQINLESYLITLMFNLIEIYLSIDTVWLPLLHGNTLQYITLHYYYYITVMFYYYS